MNTHETSAADCARAISYDELMKLACGGKPVSVEPETLRAIALRIGYLEAQDGLLSKAEDACERLRHELAETKRPLDAQMARLNQRVIELTAENERLRARRH
jgi:hypothetical protein